MTTATTSPTNIWRWSTSSGKEAGRTTRRCAIGRAASSPTPRRCIAIRHEGKNYRVDAIHLCEPSPQRTPVLYQAGTSPRGRQFAAEHAECVFMSGPSAKIIAPRVAAIRELAGEGRAQPGRHPDVQHVHHHSRPHRGRGQSQIRRLSQPHQPRGRAHLDVRLDRRRFLHLRSRPAGSPCRERRRPHRDGQHHPRRSGPGLDRARGRPACRHRRHRTGRGRHAGKGRRRDRGLVRPDRRRWPQRPLRGFARRFRGYRRHAGAGTGAARALQDRLPAGNAARKTVRRRPRAARRAASGRAVSAA